MMKCTPAAASEKTILGALLLDSSCYEEIKNMLCPNDFFYAPHQKVFTAIMEVYKVRKTFDIPMVSDVGLVGSAYLYTLAQECCSTKNIKAHAEIVREKSVQRQLIECAKMLKSPSCEEIDDQMAHDFETFTYMIRPSINEDIVELNFVCIHNASQEQLEEPINAEECRELGIGHLFGMMHNLTFRLKLRLANEDQIPSVT